MTRQFEYNGKQIRLSVFFATEPTYLTSAGDEKRTNASSLHTITGHVDDEQAVCVSNVHSATLIAWVANLEWECKRFAKYGPLRFDDLVDQLKQLGFKP